MVTFGIEPHALDDDQPLNRFRECAGEDGGDGAAQGMGNDGHGREALLADELGDVLDVLQVRIRTAHRPLRVAMAPEIRRNDVEPGTQRLRQPIPRVAVVVHTVDQQHVGRRVVAPIQVVEAQTLGEVAVGSRILAVGHGSVDVAFRVSNDSSSLGVGAIASKMTGLHRSTPPPYRTCGFACARTPRTGCESRFAGSNRKTRWRRWPSIRPGGASSPSATPYGNGSGVIET